MTGYFTVALLLIFHSLAGMAQKINGEASYVSFAVPGAFGTYPMAINVSMTVTGYYYDSPLTTRGFMREADGTITTFNMPGSTLTEPESINDAGEITGFWAVVAGIPQGFLRHADGSLVLFNDTHQSPRRPQESIGFSINEFGDIAGSFPFPFLAPAIFTRSHGGEYKDFLFGADVSKGSVAVALNSSGSVVGYYDENAGEQGFLVHPDGYSSIITVPSNHGSECPNADTIPEAINASGMIAGWYQTFTYACFSPQTGGFVYSPEGRLTLFAAPGVLPTQLPGLPSFTGEAVTAPHLISLDDNGNIAGSYQDAGGVQHGFVRNPYGTLSSFDPPEGDQTTSTSINNLGVVAGFYSYRNGGGPPVGFIRIPQS